MLYPAELLAHPVGRAAAAGSLGISQWTKWSG